MKRQRPNLAQLQVTLLDLHKDILYKVLNYLDGASYIQLKQACQMLLQSCRDNAHSYVRFQEEAALARMIAHLSKLGLYKCLSTFAQDYRVQLAGNYLLQHLLQYPVQRKSIYIYLPDQRALSGDKRDLTDLFMRHYLKCPQVHALYAECIGLEFSQEIPDCYVNHIAKIDRISLFNEIDDIHVKIVLMYTKNISHDIALQLKDKMIKYPFCHAYSNLQTFTCIDFWRTCNKADWLEQELFNYNFTNDELYKYRYRDMRYRYNKE